MDHDYPPPIIVKTSLFPIEVLEEKRRGRLDFFRSLQS
jgi:hypothetical protein